MIYSILREKKGQNVFSNTSSDQKQTNIIPVAAAIIEKAGTLLIARRPMDKELGGFWELPGGKIEEGEDPESSLRREIAEELGVVAKDLSYFDETLYRYPDKIIKLIVFRLSIHDDASPQALEHQRLAWINPSEYLNYRIAPADIYIIKKLTKQD